MPGRSFNYRAVIAYDGSAFFGYQRQASLPTVQQTLEDAILEALGEETTVFASSRTDKGVHALGQVVSFKLTKKLHLIGMRSLLENSLPPTLRIRSLGYAPDNFIARFASRKKVYCYILHFGPSDSPFVHGGSWVIDDDTRLDFEVLKKTFKMLEGHHDFACFGKATDENPNKDTHCTVEVADVEQRGDYIVFTVKGDRFLHNMVRRIVSFAVFCAKGKEAPERLQRIFNGEMCLSCAFPAPAQGLYLVKVEYEQD